MGPPAPAGELRQRLCLEYQCPGWTSADEQAWPVVRQRVKGPGPRFFRGFSLGGRDGMRSAGELMQFVRVSRFANVGHVRHFFSGLLLSFSCLFSALCFSVM